LSEFHIHRGIFCCLAKLHSLQGVVLFVKEAAGNFLQNIIPKQ